LAGSAVAAQAASPASDPVQVLIKFGNLHPSVAHMLPDQRGGYYVPFDGDGNGQHARIIQVDPGADGKLHQTDSIAVGGNATITALSLYKERLSHRGSFFYTALHDPVANTDTVLEIGKNGLHKQEQVFSAPGSSPVGINSLVPFIFNYYGPARVYDGVSIADSALKKVIVYYRNGESGWTSDHTYKMVWHDNSSVSCSPLSGFMNALCRMSGGNKFPDGAIFSLDAKHGPATIHDFDQNSKHGRGIVDFVLARRIFTGTADGLTVTMTTKGHGLQNIDATDNQIVNVAASKNGFNVCTNSTNGTKADLHCVRSITLGGPYVEGGSHTTSQANILDASVTNDGNAIYRARNKASGNVFIAEFGLH